MLSIVALGFGFAALAVVSAQQYAGQTIPNSLPAVTDATVAFFNVNDPTGKKTTLINYFSAPNGTTLNTANVQRAIIVLHGANRDPYNYFNDMHSALNNASALYNSEISIETVAIMAPYFPNQDDENLGYPYNSSGSYTNALVWTGYLWSGGINNVFPTSTTTISTFTALDQVLQYFDDIITYPQLKQIVVAGHSMGAQMVQRYAVIGEQLGLRVPVTYWLGNPDSFAWLNTSRPIAPVNCTTYDNWEWGLTNYSTPTQTYNTALVARGTAAVQANYNSRNLAYARGLNDNGDYGEGCSPYSQGTNRGTRFLAFLTSFQPNSLDTVDYYPGVGHNDLEMFSYEPGSYRLFLDNWNGNVSKAGDFGPRQIAGDNPHPTSTP